VNWFRLLQHWRAISWSDRGLFIEAVWLSFWARTAVLLLPWSFVVRWMGDPLEIAPGSADADPELLQRVGRTVRRVERRVPWQSKCLIQAMSAKTMLSRRGVAGTIYLGLLRVAEEDEEKFKSHAWLRCGPRFVTGWKGHEPFLPMSTFAFGPCPEGQSRTTFVPRKKAAAGQSGSELNFKPGVLKSSA
jgi:hypothetical protein